PALGRGAGVLDAEAGAVPLTLYVPAASRLHRLHPVTKLAGLAAFIVAAFVVDRPLALAPLAAAIAGLLVPAGGLPNVRRLRVMFVLVFVFSLVVWTLFYGGRFGATYAGFLYGLSTAIRLDTFLAAGILFLTTTRVEEVAYALGRLGMPYLRARAGGADALAGAVLATTTIAYVALWRSGLGLLSG